MGAGGRTDRPVVLICRSGKRTVDAGLALEAAGLLQQRAHRFLQLFELTAAQFHQLALRIDTHLIDAAQVVGVALGLVDGADHGL